MVKIFGQLVISECEYLRFLRRQLNDITLASTIDVIFRRLRVALGLPTVTPLPAAIFLDGDHELEVVSCSATKSKQATSAVLTLNAVFGLTSDHFCQSAPVTVFAAVSECHVCEWLRNSGEVHQVLN